LKRIRKVRLEPNVFFEEPLTEHLAFEIEQKGWCAIAIAELPDGKRVKLFFYDPVRLTQDLETDSATGETFIAEPGLIVIPKVTREYMENAVKRLYRKGYFNSLVPLS